MSKLGPSLTLMSLDTSSMRRRHPEDGKESKVLLRAHLLATASEKFDCRIKLGDQIGR